MNKTYSCRNYLLCHRLDTFLLRFYRQQHESPHLKGVFRRFSPIYRHISEVNFGKKDSPIYLKIILSDVA